MALLDIEEMDETPEQPKRASFGRTGILRKFLEGSAPALVVRFSTPEEAETERKYFYNSARQAGLIDQVAWTATKDCSVIIAREVDEDGE